MSIGTPPAMRRSALNNSVARRSVVTQTVDALKTDEFINNQRGPIQLSPTLPHLDQRGQPTTLVADKAHNRRCRHNRPVPPTPVVGDCESDDSSIRHEVHLSSLSVDNSRPPRQLVPEPWIGDKQPDNNPFYEPIDGSSQPSSYENKRFFPDNRIVNVDRAGETSPKTVDHRRRPEPHGCLPHVPAGPTATPIHYDAVYPQEPIIGSTHGQYSYRHPNGAIGGPGPQRSNLAYRPPSSRASVTDLLPPVSTAVDTDQRHRPATEPNHHPSTLPDHPKMAPMSDDENRENHYPMQYYASRAVSSGM